MKRTIAAAAATLAIASSSTVIAENTTKRIVLIHGAFTTSESWDPVAQILEAKGLTVSRAELPLTSLAEDVAAAQAAMDTGTGPAVLVGHSWGGVVMGEVGTSDDVAALVYVSAFAPDKGETLAALSANGPASEGAKAMYPNDKGLLFVNEEKFPDVFASDLPKDKAMMMAQAQRPLAASSLGSPTEAAAWNVKPTHYVLSMSDKVIDPAVQTFFATRMGAEVTKLDTSHVPHLAQPEAVAEVILKAAGAE